VDLIHRVVAKTASFVGDGLEDCGRIIEDLLVRKSEQDVAQGPKIRITVGVMSGLFPHLMHTAVELYDQFQLEAAEIRNEDRDRELAAEL
jgi:hypothetical protein